MIRLILAAAAAAIIALPVRAAVEITEVTSPGGFTAWLVEEHSIPFAAVEIRFRGGTSLDAPDKRGAVNLMTALLEEGSGDMDARAFAEAREDLAASIRFDSSDDELSVSVRFLSENRDATIALVKQALTDPRFDPEPLERVRAQSLAGIRSDLTDPGTIANLRLAEMTWDDHPYGSPGEGTIESVSALTREDMFEAHAGAIARDRVYVAAVGDITPAQLADLMDTVLGDLPETGAPLPEIAENGLEPGLTVVEFDTPQAVALFGHEGIERDDPDFFAAYVVNEIMGGSGLKSRLTEEVRVRRGLTYGVGSYLVLKDYGPMLLGQVSTENARMAETIDVIRAEWTRIAEEGITETELEEAKLYLTGAYPLRFDGNGTIAGIMVGMQMEGQPIDYIATRNGRVNAITLEEANRVAARIYRPEDLHIVIVGLPGEIGAGN